ncbi:MAG: histidine--tRNA ligase [Candidatus Saccharibacteria bacterium]
MVLSTQPYKGARDFYPEDKRLQKFMFNIMRRVVESFGYEEYDAPILEPIELYLAKTGEEIVNDQTYSFTDRGDRKVVIRPEMTPTVSRMVAAKRQELAYPLRWYSIPNLWRYERPQRGRLREHWQLNVDIFGVAGLEAEHELILVADGILQQFGASRESYVIKLNTRKLMNHIFENYLGLKPARAHDSAKLIDRMHKMDVEVFSEALQEIIQDQPITNKLISILQAKNVQDLPKILQKHPSVGEIERLQKLLLDSGLTNAVFDITLMRGFDYYTDIVFEVFDTHPDNNRAMFGGGRYDGLVGLFGVEPVPTVGFGMGDVTLQNFLETHKLLPKDKPESDLYVVLVGDTYAESQPTLQALRQAGLNLVVDTTGRKPDKQTKTADKKNLHYVIFIGKKELQENTFTLKDLRSGKTISLNLMQLTKLLKS